MNDSRKAEDCMQKSVDTNEVIMIGKMESSKFTTSSVHGITFYNGYLLVERTSGKVDRIPISVNEKIFTASSPEIWKGKIGLNGKIVTYNDKNGHLFLSVQVTTVTPQPENACDKNLILMQATICRSGYRETPFGRRIVDLILACNRRFKSSYVPSIVWGWQADIVKNFKIGTKLFVKGRLQSRIYTKCYSDDLSVEKEAYELSISAFDVVR